MDVIIVIGGILLGGSLILNGIQEHIERKQKKAAEMEYYSPHKPTAKPRVQVVKSYTRVLPS